MDLLRWAPLATFARRRHARLWLQVPLLAVAIVVVVHGLLGPQLAPRNLATVLTWVHYRGLLVVAILAIGNLFCFGCPMILARDVARRVAHPGWRWPRALRNKWPAIVLFVAVLFAYELFDLWSLPRATAWLVLAYFGAAMVVDVLFSGASFCKYVCPIGQFNFVAATMAPAELQVRNRSTCVECRTVDCIKGRRETVVARPAAAASGPTMAMAADAGPPPAVARRRVVQRGCELGLFLPAKVGNLDCTLCLDCVHACPHDNIALSVRVPGDELADTRRRSGIGFTVRRADLAALAAVFTFGALLNAFAMTAPAASAERILAGVLHTTSDTRPLAALFVLALVVAPLALLWTTAGAARLLSGGPGPISSDVVRFAYALVPLGVGLWTAHYAFHLLTGLLTVVPVSQSAVIDLTGRALAGEPRWTWVGLQPGSVFPLQIGCVLLGTIGSLLLVYRLSDSAPKPLRATALPWSLLIVALAIAGTWVLMQPMQMRGIGAAG